MYSRIRFALGYWLCWVGYFECSRLLFSIFHWHEVVETGWIVLLKSLMAGLKMDFSMASYFLVPVCLLIGFEAIFPKIKTEKIIKIYSLILLMPVTLLVLCDIQAYTAWGYRLDATPLKYLQTPQEAWASVSHLPLFWIILGYMMLVYTSYLLFSKLISYLFPKNSMGKPSPIQIGSLLLFTIVQIVPIRGGFQLAPLNQSSVFFSQKAFANHTAINVVWNFMHSLTLDLELQKNPFEWMDEKSAQQKIDELYHSDNTHITVLDSSAVQKPNVVLIIWESLTKKVIHQKHKDIEVTPGLNRLIQEGVYFSDLYATGDRTDKGIVGVLSGYPAQPTTSIIKIPQKADKLPKLPKIFSDQGYQTSFFYGGELEFANMKSYLLGCGFDKMTEKNDFDVRDQNSKWGAHDGVVKNRFLNDLKISKEPFFSTWLTLSSHEPYETPVSRVIEGDDDVSQFLNSIHYTDSIVFDLINELKQLPSWKNTLVVIVADHGHRLPRSNQKIEDFKIPMLWLGGILNGAKNVSTTASQIDLPHTLLAQLRMQSSAFKWSKNIFSPIANPWAYYCFNNGFGFVQQGRSLVFDNVGKQIIEQLGAENKDLLEYGKAMEQLSFGDYLKK
jgi:phosphoglycerol transferase MdoB-like AlkP superfamily enzyme